MHCIQTIDTGQSWALSVFFFYFFNNKNYFFAFFYKLITYFCTSPIKKPTPSLINLTKMQKIISYY